MNSKDVLNSMYFICTVFKCVCDRCVFCVQMQLRRECSLAELMDQETCMVKQIRSLDSDMQTLVYENYNKFISATGEETSDSLLCYCAIFC